MLTVTLCKGWFKNHSEPVSFKTPSSSLSYKRKPTAFTLDVKKVPFSRPWVRPHVTPAKQTLATAKAALPKTSVKIKLDEANIEKKQRPHVQITLQIVSENIT